MIINGNALTKKNRREVIVEILNSYGETGFIKGFMRNEPKNKISEDFILELRTPKKTKMRLKIFIKSPKEQFDSFCALSVKDVNTNEVLYENENREVFKKFNYKNFYPKDPRNEDWRKDEGTKFLLANIGQYVEFSVPKGHPQRRFMHVRGILKCVYNNPLAKNRRIIQILIDKPYKNSDIIAQFILPKEYTISSTSFMTGETETLNYGASHEDEEQFIQ